MYATAENSRELSEFSIKAARTEQSKIDIKAIEKLVNVSYEAGGRVMRYPMGRNLVSGFMGLFIGGIFTGAGWYLIQYEGHPIMGGVFGLVGLLIVLTAFYMVLNSLDVSQAGSHIRTVRRILGIPVKRGQIRRADFVRFKKIASSSTQSGKQHVVHYKISAVDRHGEKLVFGEGFEGASQADAAAEYIGRLFGLVPQDDEPETESAVDDYNLLTAD